MSFLRRTLNRLRGHSESVYEPAGIIHNGEFRFGDYYAQATPQRTYHVWEGNTYIGEYPGERIDIVMQLHQRNQE